MNPEADTRLVGILNLTPDSFSDGGAHAGREAILHHAARLIDEGADILDIGAESTRPGAMPIEPEEEWARLATLPELIALCRLKDVKTSLDTRHPETARKALAAGIDWINDVGGLADSRMVEAVGGSTCKVVLMHSLGIPPSAARILPEKDPIPALKEFFSLRLAQLAKAGIDQERIILDPGIGFGKTPAQSMRILAEWQALRLFGLPILLGHSRKSFLSPLFQEIAERDIATYACSIFVMAQRVDYLRVHSIGKHATLRSLLSS